MAEPGRRTAALLLNWRQPALTLACLDDLLAARDEALDVLVIDNGSGDDSLAVLRAGLAAREAACPPHAVELLALADNLGFCGGMNRGIAWAHARGRPFALVLNNDLRLPEGGVHVLAEVLANDPRVAAVGPTVLHPDGSVWAEGGCLGFAPNGLRLRGHGRPPRPRESGPELVPFLPAACVLYRTEELAAIGGFDERFFMYWEDVDLCDRLRLRGGRIVWLPWVRVVHASGASSGGGRSPLRKYLMACNAVRYLRARPTVRAWLAWLCFDVLLWPLTLATGPHAAFAKLRGTLAGLCGHRASAADVARFLPDSK